MIIMRHYEYNDDEFSNDVDKFWKGDDDDDENMNNEMEEEFYNKEVIHAIEMQLAEKDLDLRLLKVVIKMLESSFWWKFYNFKTKLKMISRSYMIFFKTMQKTREIEEEGETQQ